MHSVHNPWIAAIIIYFWGFRSFGEHPYPSWKIGIMEYWNDEERRRKTKNLFFPDFNTRN
jgi:hypothetical protein